MGIKRGPHQRFEGDRGAFLVLFALLLVVIITFVSFVVDLGQARASQRSNRSTADLAALSAGHWLAGGAFTGTQPVADPVKACISAVQSVRTNEPSFQPSESPAVECAKLTCDPLSPAAGPSAVFNDDQMTLTIEYPVLVGGLSDTRFSGPGVKDGSDPCERMRITLRRTDDVSFAGVIGVTSLSTTGSVVVKGDIKDPRENAVPAFLILERTDCGSVLTGVGDGEGIEVQATVNLKGEPQPGYMHSDSDASGSCGGSDSDHAIYGGNSKSPESIILQPHIAGSVVTEGIFETRADPTKGVGGYFRGTYRVGGLVSRQPADDIYKASLEGVHSSAYSALSLSLLDAATAQTNGYDVFGCDKSLLLEGSATNVRAFIFCPLFQNAWTLTGYREVVFSGKVDLSGPSSGNDISLPDATDIVIGGGVFLAGGGSNQSVFDAPAAENITIGDRVVVPKNGVLSVNRGGPAPLTTASETPTCPARFDPDDANTTVGNTSRVVIFSSSSSPALDITGNFTLCEGTLYLAGPRSPGNSAYLRESKVTGTDANGGECSGTLPCPVSTADLGARYLIASGATVNLVGPNTTTAPAPTTGWTWSVGQDGGVEDLAFWSETGGLSDIRGSAILSILGVFSAPNGTFEFRSGPSDTDPTDSQYIARKVKMFNGRLNMLPTAANTVSVPIPGSFTLIR